MSIPTIQGLAGIVSDPEPRASKTGTPILAFRLAFSDRKYNDQTREWETSKSFYVDGAAWEHLAERLAGDLAKGDQVYVEGRLETQSWEKDGEKKSKPVLNVKALRKLEKGGNGGQQQGGAGNFASLGAQPVGNAPVGWGAPAAQAQGGWGAVSDAPAF